jgi:plasmid stability protein
VRIAMAKKMISLEITDELREALRVEAFKRSLSISALIRQLLEAALATEHDGEHK